MSKGPISVPESSIHETWSDHDLFAAGWKQADLDWEVHAAAQCEALARGDETQAKARAGRCLFVAREAFAADDPRLATSLANFARCLAGEGDPAADALWQEARRRWPRSQSWIASMAAPRVARSSLFHMRMEQRHRATYEERWRIKWHELAQAAKARLESCDLARPIAREAAAAALERWRRERPAMLNDTRKLLAAVLLLLPGS
jgi:hypothetical protein